MKKLLSILLAAMMVAGAIVMTGCADNNTTPSATTASGSDQDVTTEPEETEVSDDLPSVTFKGKTFRVLLQEQSEDDLFTEDHETGDPLHDAVFRRNNLVSDRFGIELEIEVDAWSSVNETISRSVKAGSDEYDLCFVHMVSGAALAQSNLVLPFEKLPYVNLEKPWWDKDIRKFVASALLPAKVKNVIADEENKGVKH